MFATLAFVLVNATAVVALSAVRPRGTQECGGGFSGESGGGSGGGCSADLSIIKVDAPDPVPVHGRVFYLLEVTNNGPDQADVLNIQDKLPAGVEVDWVLSSNQPYGSCLLQAQAVFCTFYGLLVHQKIAVTIVIRPVLAGTIKDVATVSCDTPDPNPANNRASQTTTVTG